MPPGRPSRLTKQVADNLVKAVGLGLSYKDAAAVAGIGKSTFHEWKKRAEIAERSNKYTVLMERIDAALQKRGEEYLDAVRRSILEDIIIEKTHSCQKTARWNGDKGDPRQGMTPPTGPCCFQRIGKRPRVPPAIGPIPLPYRRHGEALLWPTGDLAKLYSGPPATIVHVDRIQIAQRLLL